jgi:predicted RNA-binding Zn-ribbon protein involved in translation (DUF1610 family)
MASYLRNNGHAPGSWKPLVDSGKMSASFACPKCGKVELLTNHQIGKGGVVTPSVVCQTEGCNFHENIILEGWLFT